jgi:hypothetical protein
LGVSISQLRRDLSHPKSPIVIGNREIEKHLILYYLLFFVIHNPIAVFGCPDGHWTSDGGVVASAVDSISSNNDHPIYLKIGLESSQIALSDELLPIK